jgi:multiple sugar transport system permease protein
MATGIKEQDRQDTVAGWLFMSPTLVILGVFMLLPMVFALYFSFTDWNGISPPDQAQWVGLDNFRLLLLEDGIRRADFFKALKNTFYFSLGVVPLQTAIALFLAVVVNQRRLRFKDFFRTSYYLPAITSSIAISMLFLFLYQKNGLINQVLQWLTFGVWQPIAWMSESSGLFHIMLGWFGVTLRTGPEWLQNEILSLTVWDWISGPSIALMAIMLMNTWTTIGTMMVIFIAALQDVPTPVYEAAEMDGANAWQTFSKITVPLLRPTLFFVITLGLIGTFQVFDQI